MATIRSRSPERGAAPVWIAISARRSVCGRAARTATSSVCCAVGVRRRIECPNDLDPRADQVRTAAERDLPGCRAGLDCHFRIRRRLDLESNPLALIRTQRRGRQALFEQALQTLVHCLPSDVSKYQRLCLLLDPSCPVDQLDEFGRQRMGLRRPLYQDSSTLAIGHDIHRPWQGC